MKILIVVDVQHDFVDGILGTPEAQKAIPAIQQKIAEYESDDNAIIYFTRDTHNAEYMASAEGHYLPVQHCLKNTYGWDFAIKLNPEHVKRHFFINKPTFGYIDWASEFDSYMDEITSIEVIGFCTDICVVSNALIIQAVMRTLAQNPPIIMCDASCCAGVTPEAHQAAIKVMKSCQIEVID